MATFIGTNQYGVFGALAATIGVALPSFIIILLIATLGSKFKLKHRKRSIQGLETGCNRAYSKRFCWTIL